MIFKMTDNDECGKIKNRYPGRMYLINNFVLPEPADAVFSKDVFENRTVGYERINYGAGG